MRIRTIKPEFFLHSGLFDLEEETKLPIRLAFAGLWCAADREGRFCWKPRELKIQILPYDTCDFSRVLHALVTRGFVVHYASGGKEYGAIPSFGKHQVINNKERESTIPSQTESTTLTRDSRVGDALTTRANLDQVEGKGREGNMEQGREGNMEQALISSDHPVEKPKVRKQPEQYHCDTRTVLYYLNQATGRNYRELAANLDPISARLNEAGVDLEGVKTMIDRQVKLWGGTEMQEYLKPTTLFRVSKFDGYYASRLVEISRPKTAFEKMCPPPLHDWSKEQGGEIDFASISQEAQ